MRGKDKAVRDNKGYRIRWLEHRLDKQKKECVKKINRLKEKHSIFLEVLKEVLKTDFNIKWSKINELVRIEIEDEKAEKEMWEELEHLERLKELNNKNE